MPGVKYRVFHYGLEFKAGNWSFDKANWRHVDLVNKCWAKFPDPPDPKTLVQTDNDVLQRDLLSIECGSKLNEALRLHHERKKCPDPNSLATTKETRRQTVKPNQTKPTTESAIPRKFGNIDESADEIQVMKRDSVPKNNSQESVQPEVTNGTFNSMRFWIIVLWAVSILGFVAVMSMMLSRRKGLKRRGKSYKPKRRASHSGFWDANGNDRHLRSTETA